MKICILLFSLICSLSSMADILIKDINIQNQASKKGFLISFDERFNPELETPSGHTLPLESKEENGQFSYLFAENEKKLLSLSIDRHLDACFFTSHDFIDFKMPDPVARLLDDIKKNTRHFLFFSTEKELRSFGKNNIRDYYIISPIDNALLQFLANHPQVKHTKERGFLIIYFARRELE